MLELVDVRTGYGRSEVIHGASLTVPADGVAAVMGHNGAGKTTLLRAAVGLLKVNSGKVLFDGEDVSALRPSARVARGLAYVPQGQQSFGQLTTAENLQVV
ncbi:MULTISPECIES: ATP-binding cassette domain-containing protein, partial [unclassified Rhodococcus (in: high G+C Gram-positive bacteria)]